MAEQPYGYEVAEGQWRLFMGARGTTALGFREREGAKGAEVFVKWTGDKSANALEIGPFQKWTTKGFLNVLEPNGFCSFLKWKKS